MKTERGKAKKGIPNIEMLVSQVIFTFLVLDLATLPIRSNNPTYIIMGIDVKRNVTRGYPWESRYFKAARLGSCI